MFSQKSNVRKLIDKSAKTLSAFEQMNGLKAQELYNFFNKEGVVNNLVQVNNEIAKEIDNQAAISNEAQNNIIWLNEVLDGNNKVLSHCKDIINDFNKSYFNKSYDYDLYDNKVYCEYSDSYCDADDAIYIEDDEYEGYVDSRMDYVEYCNVTKDWHLRETMITTEDGTRVYGNVERNTTQ